MKTKEELDKMTIPQFFEYMTTLHKIALLSYNNLEDYIDNPPAGIEELSTFSLQLRLATQVENEADFARNYLDEYTSKAVKEAKESNKASGLTYE